MSKARMCVCTMCTLLLLRWFCVCLGKFPLRKKAKNVTPPLLLLLFWADLSPQCDDGGPVAAAAAVVILGTFLGVVLPSKLSK